jgi:hypothetical protein
LNLEYLYPGSLKSKGSIASSFILIESPSSGSSYFHTDNNLNKIHTGASWVVEVSKSTLVTVGRSKIFFTKTFSILLAADSFFTASWVTCADWKIRNCSLNTVRKDDITYMSTEAQRQICNLCTAFIVVQCSTLVVPVFYFK